MTQEGFKRKLTAILSADAVGYSRLMRDDEEATVSALAAHRILIAEIIHQHNGRVVDSPGDNLLSEFASVVDAVNSAIKIQAEMKSCNIDTPEDRRMEFRIGINLGDVIEEEERIYGDGVNIAARVEGLAAAGGISISGTVYEHIKDKLSIGYHFLGEQNVKNIPEPIRVYRLLTAPNEAGKMIGGGKSKSGKFRYATFGALAVATLVVTAVLIWNNFIRVQFEPASLEKMVFSLPDKPSVAVLPFDNLSGDPNHNHICDGISESIISTLSKVPELFVIARNSSFFYKGKAFKVKQVAEDLGVRYVLEGSVQKSTDKIRVTAQLIDAIAGHHLWSEKYDREMKELFQIFDDISLKITAALQITLVGKKNYAIFKTNSLEAWSYCIKGLTQFNHYTKEENKRARYLFEQAIKIDPEYSFAWMGLAYTYFADARLGYGESFSDSLEHASQFAQKASSIDKTFPELHTLWCLIYLFQGKYEQSIVAGQKSIEFNPNNADGYIFYATTLHYVGRIDEAVAMAEHSIRLNPQYPSWYLFYLSAIYREARNYNEALFYANKLLNRAQNEQDYFSLFAAHLQLTIIYAINRNYEKAQFHWTEIKKINPNYNLDLWLKMFSKFAPFKDPAPLERIGAALLEAGLK